MKTLHFKAYWALINKLRQAPWDHLYQLQLIKIMDKWAFLKIRIENHQDLRRIERFLKIIAGVEYIEVLQ
jgi:hypothetical protein